MRALILFFALLLAVNSHADCLPHPSGLIGWWPGDGNANNVLGTNHGTLQGGALANAPGLVGTAFNFDGTNGSVQIPNSPLLQPTNLTIEAWIRFSGLDSAGTGPAAGIQNIIFKQNTQSSGFEGFDLGKTRVSGSDYFRFIVSSGSGQTATIRSSTTISTGVWYHVAAVRGSNFTQLYVNGVLERQTNVAFAQNYGTQPLYFGTTGQSYWDRRFKGNLDEVSLYNRALGSNEITAVYSAGAAGKCKGPNITQQPQPRTVVNGGNATFSVAATGFGTLNYQWRFNGTEILIATNSALVLTNINFNQVGNYSVLVTDSGGSTLSARAGLSISRIIAWGNNNYGQTNLPAGLSNPVAIAAGNAHAAALTDEGRVVVWGESSMSKTNVPAHLTNVTAVAAGGFHTIALQNGTVTAWGGYNQLSELNVPVGLSNVVALDAGYHHNLALKTDGSVIAWGDNFWGQSTVPENLSNVVAISAGGFRSLALKSDGTIVTWGNGGNYFPPGLREVVEVCAGGESFSLALRSDGTIVAWGNNGGGQLNVPSGLSNITAIAGGDYFGLALKNDGTVVAWENNNVPESATNITAIAAGAGFGLALMNYPLIAIIRQPVSQTVFDGQTALLSVVANGIPPLSYQWQFNGTNLAGATNSLLALANASTTNTGNYQIIVSNSAGTVISRMVGLAVIHSAPLISTSPASQQALFGTNAYFTVQANGSRPLAYQWQFNDMDIPGATNSTLALSNLRNSAIGNYRVVVSNEFGSAATSNALLCVTPIAAWGYNDFGHDFGQTMVPFGLSNVLAVAGGSYHSLALKSDGTVAAWGLNFNGQANIPVGLSNVVAIAGGSAYSLALRSDGSIVAWGSAPAIPAGVSNVIAIAAGDSHCLALKNNGQVLAWGSNSYGQTNIPAGLNDIVAIAAGSWNSLLLRKNGSVIVVGANLNGIADVPSDAQDLMAIAQGGVHNLGLKRDGSVVPWGDNTYGENVLPPGVSDNIVSVATAAWYNLALRNDGTPVVWGSQNTVPNWIRNVRSIATGGNHILALIDDGSPVFVPQTFNFFETNQLSASGRDLALSMPVTGAQPISYRWFFNGLLLADGPGITGAQTTTLKFVNAQTNVSGIYQLVASNALGMVTSAVTTLTVLDPPVILQSPQNQSAILGSNVVLSVQTSGSAPLGYTWYFNGAPLANNPRLTGTTTAMLSISNVQTADAGNYSLILTNTVGMATSVVATLTVITPPSITTQLRSYSVPIGLPVTLSGAATGTAPLQYSWLFNGAPVPNAIAASLTITNLSAAQFGNYQLVVTNFGGAVTSAVAQLTLGPVATWGNIGQVASFPIWPAAGLSNVIAVSAGQNYSLALRQDGSVYFWGNNNQVSNLPPNLTGVVGIAAGQSHALALLSNGIVRAWGLGSSGQTNVPTNLSNVIAVAAGSAHSAALHADGTVVVWGGTPTDAQTNIPPGLMKVSAIDAGGSQTLALREDGMLIGWGGRTQYPVPSDLKNVTGFSAGPAFSALNLSLTSNGLVRAWGGFGSATNVPPGLSGIIAIEGAGGNDQSTGVALAVRSNRTVAAWGSNVGGVNSLINVPAGLSNVVALAGGTSHVLALVNDGSPLIIRPPVGGTFYSGRDLVLKAKAIGVAPLSFQWFKNGNPIPGGTDESLVLTLAQASDAGSYHVVASNALGVAQSVAVPVAVVGSAPVLISQPVGRFAYCGSPLSVGASVIGSGQMEFTWLQNGVPTYTGTNDLVFDRALAQHDGNFQLIASNPFGSVTSSVAQIKFTRIAVWGNGLALTNVPFNLGDVVAVAAGSSTHGLVIKSDSTVSAWGKSLNGTTNVPVGLSNVVAIAGGSFFSVALKNDGTVTAWGLNNRGQTNVPAGLTDVMAISVGDTHSLALRSNGTVVAWGSYFTQITNVPANLSNVVAVSAGYTHSLALKSDGTIVGWGSVGKIPVTTNCVAIAAGSAMSLALQADGTVVTWPSFTSTGGSPLPASLSNVVAISSMSGPDGYSAVNSVVLKSNGDFVAWGSNYLGQLNVPAEIVSGIYPASGGGFTLVMLNDRSPYIATQPMNRHAVSGKNVTLAALAVGQPTLNYQWRLNGTNIPGAINSTLTLTNVSRNSRGFYSALVRNSLGTTNSREAWLDVVGPVRLLPPTLSAGGELSFGVTDSSGGALIADDLGWLEAQASSNLVNWTTLTNSLIFTNGALLLQVAAQTNYPARFYRLIER